MTDAAAPVAAWYPDPTREGRLRWWDGTAWTAQVRETAPAVPQVVTMPELRAPSAWSPETPPTPPSKAPDWRPAEPGPDPKYLAEPLREWRKNNVATLALILGVVNVAVLVLASFVYIIPNIRYVAMGIGVVTSIAAVRQAQRVEIGLRRAAIALALNLLVVVVVVVLWAQLLSSAGEQLGDRLGGELDNLTNYANIVEVAIHDRAATDQEVGVLQVTCPDDMERITGEVYLCTETLADGTRLRVQVEVTDDNGGFTYEVLE